MTEVFKTNVHEAAESEALIKLLCAHFPDSTISFDLEDCDRVLRLAPLHSPPDAVIHILQHHGYHCEVLS